MKTSMIITTFNRGHLLDTSLRRLAQLTLPDEILVIDDGGDDNTEQVCDTARSQFLTCPIKYLYNDNPGPSICSMARNIGIKYAEHEWLVTAEPELIYRTDIIDQFKMLTSEHAGKIISAGTIHFAPEGWGGGIMNNEIDQWELAGDYTPPKDSQEAIGWVAPYTALWYRPWLVEVGGWDEGFPGPWGWDDIDLLTRLRINGHGQHIALECGAVHQFHGLGGDVNQINEEYWKAKSFNHGDESKTEDIVANKEIEWGKLNTKNS